MAENNYIRWFDSLGSDDTAIVGGKNASLGEMISALKEEGIRVPDGFATTAQAYREFLKANELDDKIKSHLEELKQGKIPLEKAGKSIRRLFLDARFPDKIASAIRESYGQMSDRYQKEEVDIAARSSATAEDLPEASFAGQQETFLNVTGAEEVLEACRKCYASLFTDRAISYREEQDFDHMKVALSVGVQKMVRSDKSSAGVMFSIDTESGFPDVVLINGAWGLGENVVQGSVTPDEYRVFKPLLEDQKLKPIVDKTLGEKQKKMVYAKGKSQTTENIETSAAERQSFVLEDEEILQLGRWGSAIEAHYQRPMDMEWAKDGETGELFIVQARPETVQSQKEAATLKTYSLKEKGEKILEGVSIGDAIAAAKVSRVKSAEDINKFEAGSILVTGMTDPDWVPIMKQAEGIITDRGGRTCHAAIVSRELGIPAIVGTGNATDELEDGQEITLSCAEGDRGYIYQGILEYEANEVNLEDIPKTQTQIMMNIASPGAAFRRWRLPCEGIGLARMEFIVNNIIKIHPMALLHFDKVEDESDRKEIERLTRAYSDKTEYFVDNLARGIGKIAAAQYPNPVIVRMSDFKSNEYADLIGGRNFEPTESNPMLGFRGASRYYSDRYREGFSLECRALKRVREAIGLSNVIIMIPFCRTLKEADRVLDVMAENDLKRGENGLQVYVMAEIPANIELAPEFCERFDGFSIGSNDLTQLVLGVDRDSEELAELFDERNEAVKRAIRRLIHSAHEGDRKVGICGQAPSDYPDFAAFLVETGIDSISLNPDSVVQIKKRVAKMENQQ
ncbi:phosphoenolpyruvate synthase [Phormidium sp. CCY1219]|uniref:phosphoenolpyruvate synthase n=1 Tax=Phormidium sp. CCY1219 TaxID=2886104 RepID=UPI002D1F0ECE|nr:phosphoenolpyruvate synthase [Phormidium sp. CCY1219]MEB3827411.1 phosphoenolpyruvate synthase [Phormidium sp. CCY1219]